MSPIAKKSIVQVWIMMETMGMAIEMVVMAEQSFGVDEWKLSLWRLQFDIL
jgi:hypothetical protein